MMISPFNVFPPYWGGAARTLGILRGLLESEEVVVHLVYPDRKQVEGDHSNNPFDYITPEDFKGTLTVHSVPAKSRISQLVNPRIFLTALKILRRKKGALIWGEFTWSGLSACLLSFFTRNPMILDEHNIEHVRFKRFGSFLYPIIKIVEYITWIVARFILVVSSTDRQFLPKFIKSKAIVVPNGYDSSKFKPNPSQRTAIREAHGLAQSSKLLLFFGKLDYYPNYDAINVIKTHLAPNLSETVDKILIVGSGLTDASELPKNCAYLGPVQEIADYINAVDVVIVPLRSGGGTRLKIIEALACGVPVVATGIGAEGLTDDKFTGLLLVSRDDDWKEFASLVRQALEMRAAGDEKRAILEQVRVHSWKSISRILNLVLQRFGE
ncbi:MAG: glycosyltransferase family 4 protein [Promethearchaeota archaeon]